jgi:hypothetical protein
MRDYIIILLSGALITAIMLNLGTRDDRAYKDCLLKHSVGECINILR